MKIAGEKSVCFDRNKNGKIDTYEGRKPVPAQFQWAAGAKESPDECVLWLTQLNTDAGGNPVTQTMPRAAGYDGGSSTVCCHSMPMLASTTTKGRPPRQPHRHHRQGFNVSPSAPYGLVLDRAATSGSWAWSRAAPA